MTRPHVVVVHYIVPDYRAVQLNIVRERLDRAGITLDVLYSSRYDQRRRAPGSPRDWMIRVPGWEVSLGELGAVAWQAIFRRVQDADLVVLEFALRSLSSHVTAALRSVRGRRTAAWGHGADLQRPNRPLTRWVRARRTLASDWFFAYNELSADIVAATGYPRARITPVGNTLDTVELGAARRRLRRQDVDRARESLGLSGTNVGIFSGGMYPEKRLDFLAAAARAIRAALPSFELILLGDGIDREAAVSLARDEDWVHFLGRRGGAQRLPYFEMADVTLTPGKVGLGIVDAFALATPPVATRYPYHSPEFAYLVDGENGLLADDSPEAFAKQVVHLLTDRELHQRLTAGCERTAAALTVEKTADRYADGIGQCLSAPPIRAS